METYEGSVAEIVANVRRKRKMKLFLNIQRNLTGLTSMRTIFVSRRKRSKKPMQKVDPKPFLNVMRKALVNIRAYHEKQKQIQLVRQPRIDGTHLRSEGDTASSVSAFMFRVEKRFILLRYS